MRDLFDSQEVEGPAEASPASEPSTASADSEAAEVTGEMPTKASAEEAGAPQQEGAESGSDSVRCQRCHRLTHYGDNMETGLTAMHFRNQLSFLSNMKVLVVQLIDIVDFEASFVRDFDLVIGKNPLVVVANKMDLLPKGANLQRIRNWIFSILNESSIRNQVVDVHLISSKTGQQVKPLLQTIDSRAWGRDVVVVGTTNAGKSTFLNYVTALGFDCQTGKSKGNPEDQNKAKSSSARGLCVSHFPNTTLQTIKIPYRTSKACNNSWFDTPGLLLPPDKSLLSLLSTDDLRRVICTTKIVPVTYHVKVGQTVFLGAIARLQLVQGRDMFLTFYMSRNVNVHLTSSPNNVLPKLGTLLTPPSTREDVTRLGGQVVRYIEAEGAGWKQSSVDIAFSGLGWVALSGVGRASFMVTAPECVSVSTRPAIMPFDVLYSKKRFTGGLNATPPTQPPTLLMANPKKVPKGGRRAERIKQRMAERAASEEGAVSEEGEQFASAEHRTVLV